ncbi:MAG TPA: peptidoglycan DD-metalloendopeptidase family protein [Gemmatimonadota bacterium]|nr:peptidoglycan DD-metalloendopeptidase family protein [Gemmatimonadota bacterium]
MNRKPSAKWAGLASLLLWLALAGCSEEAVREFFGHYTPRERYEHALYEAGLDRTALGRDWLAAADAALDGAISILSPYREESYLDPREVSATAYHVFLRRGQQLEVQFESEPDTSYRVFIELFRMTGRPDAPPRHLASADSLERSLDHLARLDGDYLIRIQPELLRGGRYTISIVVKPSLQFPVSGRDATAIGSWYGDGRDGGRRRHEGLDIFAPRGTPVLAAADGVVRSTRSNRLGGNVVWLRDRMGHTHYYAHLDTVLVQRRQQVSVGDTLGLVGNTGNARTTPPHLHFGIYSSGSFDPYPALQRLPTTPADFTGDRGLIDQQVRVTRSAARLRAHPTARSEVLAELPLHTPLHVEAGTGGWYRVKAPDGTSGFVAANLTEPADRPLRSEVLASGATILLDPAATAVAVESIAAGAELPVLGAFGDFLFVQSPSGRLGWLALD